MKILIVAALYPPYIKGGGEISTQLLAEGLKKQGIEVTVLTISNDYSEKFLNGVKIYRIPYKNIYWSYEGKNKSKFKKVLWHLKDSYNLSIRNDFIKILNKEKPDIVHSSTIEDVSPYIWKICKEKNIPIVHTLRSYTLLCPNALMYKDNKNCDNQCNSCKLITYPKKILSYNVDTVVGISKFILDKHLKFGYFKDAKKEVIYNPYIKLNLNNKKYIKNNEIVFGFVGRLEKNKGIEYLLERYIKSDLKHKLLIFGSTQDKNYEMYLNKEFEDKRIIFMGQKKPEEVYSQITHLIVPSLWNEPFGRIIVEAYSQGIPVLGSNRGGIPEIIEENKTGLIFSIEKDDLNEKLIEFFRMKFDSNYIKNFAEKFSLENITKQYIRLYEDLK